MPTETDTSQERIEHHFRYLNLMNNRTGPLDELQLPERLSVFLMHGGNIKERGYERRREYRPLNHLLQQARLEPLPCKKGNGPLIERGKFTTFIPRSAEEFAAAPEQILHFTQSNEGRALLVTVGDLYSSTLRNETHGLIDWYLVWDDGGAWQGELSDQDAWIGSGWLNRSHRQQANEGTLLPDAMHERIEHAAQELATRRLLERTTSSPGRTEINRQVRRIAAWLAAYLPMTREHKGESWQLYSPLDLDGVASWGGPRPWFGPYHPKMHFDPLERALMLDGWLTLWERRDDQQLYLQPGSLTLLFWAANKLTLPAANRGATAFIKAHSWDGGGWFGGRWLPPGDKKNGGDMDHCNGTEKQPTKQA